VPKKTTSSAPSRPLLHYLDVGAGTPLLLLHGYALKPRTYRRLIDLLAASGVRTVAPALFPGKGPWSAESLLEDLERLLDHLRLPQLDVLGHSFGGAIALGLAARQPERVRRLVLADTLAMSRHWELAAEAVHPVHLLWMATPRATIDFASSFVTHAVRLSQAAWWGFVSDRREQIAQVARSRVQPHVLWAERDSLLSRDDGERFAKDLGTELVVVHGERAGPIDHDWLYRHPGLALDHLVRLGIGHAAASPGAESGTPN
jgi:pimeloyl-ACP methyl ester carboxylesterase